MTVDTAIRDKNLRCLYAFLEEAWQVWYPSALNLKCPGEKTPDENPGQTMILRPTAASSIQPFDMNAYQKVPQIPALVIDTPAAPAMV